VSRACRRLAQRTRIPGLGAQEPRWLRESPTEKQLQYLPPQYRQDFSLSRYQASALLSFQFNKVTIRRLVMAANDAHGDAREAA
jgi:hypothetical protein